MAVITPNLSSNLNCDDGIVNLYTNRGSAHLSTSNDRLIAMIMCSPLRKCPTQTNGNDCSVYAIANMGNILHGIDPSGVSFQVSAMRNHLQQGVENKHITAFSRRKLASVKHPLLKVSGISVFCTCRVPEHGFMFTCTICEKWFHSRCQNVTQARRQIRASKLLIKLWL